MLGLLSYIPTLAYIPHYTYLLALVYIVVKFRREIITFFLRFFAERDFRMPTNLLLIFIIIGLSLANTVLHYMKIEGIKDVVPFFLLILLTYLIAVKISRKEIIILILLIFGESLVVIAEYLNGVSTFFTGLPEYFVFDTGELWYNRRSYGLSENSSIVAAKILLAFLLIDFVRLRGWMAYGLMATFMIAMFMTFNRTSIIALTLYIILMIVRYVLSLEWKNKHLISVGIFGLAIFLCLVYFTYQYSDVLIDQLTRNQRKVDVSGRDKIWPFFIGFIKSNFVFGNGSYKLWFGDYHAHNSFIQVVATHGVVIACFYFLLILRNISIYNILPVGTLLVYSLFQYGIFWGVSLMDIGLFLFLFRSNHFSVVQPEALAIPGKPPPGPNLVSTS